MFWQAPAEAGLPSCQNHKLATFLNACACAGGLKNTRIVELLGPMFVAELDKLNCGGELGRWHAAAAAFCCNPANRASTDVVGKEGVPESCTSLLSNCFDVQVGGRPADTEVHSLPVLATRLIDGDPTSSACMQEGSVVGGSLELEMTSGLWQDLERLPMYSLCLSSSASKEGSPYTLKSQRLG
jgi:hypothetical protein